MSLNDNNKLFSALIIMLGKILSYFLVVLLIELSQTSIKLKIILNVLNVID